MNKSAKYQWQHSNAANRNQMLLSIGIRQRTLTVRHYDDLPLEIKVDLNFAAEMSNPRPGVSREANSPSWGGRVA